MSTDPDAGHLDPIISLAHQIVYGCHLLRRQGLANREGDP
jgi:hypothetical protein